MINREHLKSFLFEIACIHKIFQNENFQYAAGLTCVLGTNVNE